jgi:hypothetical protein
MTKLYGNTKYQDISFAFGEASTGDEGEPSQVIEIGAHKHVLAQWPYFRRMFESEFVEGDPGEQCILIKDVDPATFRVLIRIIYTNKILQREIPAQVCVDDQGRAIRPVSRKCFWQHIVMSSRSYARVSRRRSSTRLTLVMSAHFCSTLGTCLTRFGPLG